MKNLSAYISALKQSKETFNIARKFGFNMTLLDIGGGFPGKQNTYDLFKEVISWYINDLEFISSPNSFETPQI